jgi:hypothetical protein
MSEAIVSRRFKVEESEPRTAMAHWAEHGGFSKNKEEGPTDTVHCFSSKNDIGGPNRQGAGRSSRMLVRRLWNDEIVPIQQIYRPSRTKTPGGVRRNDHPVVPRPSSKALIISVAAPKGHTHAPHQSPLTSYLRRSVANHGQTFRPALPAGFRGAVHVGTPRST